MTFRELRDIINNLSIRYQNHLDDPVLVDGSNTILRVVQADDFLTGWHLDIHTNADYGHGSRE